MWIASVIEDTPRTGKPGPWYHDPILAPALVVVLGLVAVGFAWAKAIRASKRAAASPQEEEARESSGTPLIKP